MAKKPSYVDSLNAIANGERGGFDLFDKWANKTQDADLEPVLRTIAVREAEHSWAFEKRLSELGHPLEPTKPNGQLTKLKRLMNSNASDTEKFNAFGIGVARSQSADDQPDRLLSLLADSSIDPQTGALLGRFICEERDSGRLLTKAFRKAQRRS